MLRIAFPLGGKCADLALRCVIGQQLTRSRIERQVAGEASQGADVETTGAGAAGRRLASCRGVPIDMKIGRIELYRLGILVDAGSQRPRRQLDFPTGQRETGRRKFGGQTARHLFEVKRRQLLGQAQTDVLQRDIGGDFAQAALRETEPGAQRAAPMRQRDRIVDPLPPNRQVGVSNLRIGLPRPRLHRLDIRSAKIATQVDRRRQRFGRPRGQAETVAVAVVVERQVEVFEHQFGRLAQFVLPNQRRAANADTPLRQDPVRDIAIALLRVQWNTGDENPAIAGAAQVERWLVDAQQAQLELRTRHRPPR